jgi:hypothetical protein
MWSIIPLAGQFTVISATRVIRAPNEPSVVIKIRHDRIPCVTCTIDTCRSGNLWELRKLCLGVEMPYRNKPARQNILRIMPRLHVGHVEQPLRLTILRASIEQRCKPANDPPQFRGHVDAQHTRVQRKETSTLSVHFGEVLLRSAWNGMDPLISPLPFQLSASYTALARKPSAASARWPSRASHRPAVPWRDRPGQAGCA